MVRKAFGRSLKLTFKQSHNVKVCGHGMRTGLSASGCGGEGAGCGGGGESARREAPVRYVKVFPRKGNKS